MSEINNLTNVDKQKEKDLYLFKTPLWYYRLQTKIMNYSSLKFGALVLSAAIATLGIIILFNIFIEIQDSIEIILILFLSLLFLFLYIFWRLFAKKAKLDFFEYFAFYSEGISLNLDIISVDSELPNAPTYSINSLEEYSKKIYKLYKKSGENLKIKLNDFSKKLDNLFVLLENPNENKLMLADLSKKFNTLAEYVLKERKIDQETLEPVYSVIKGIVKPSRIDKFNNTISSMIVIWKKSRSYFKTSII